jgi:hypothetical protein
MYITDSQNMRDVKVVRALWGSYQTNISSPQYNEIVYVWGKENKSNLDNLGYTTIKMSNKPFEWGYESISYHYIHKLFAIQKSLESFDKILFLDWDVKLIKQLDDGFFNELPIGSFQAPLYNVSKEHIQKIPFMDETFIGLEKKFTPNYTWEYEDLYAKVNACCIYANNSEFGNDLIKITNSNMLGSYVEEFAIFKQSDTTLDNYILNHHPKYISISNDGKLQSHISELIDINPYFSY